MERLETKWNRDYNLIHEIHKFHHFFLDFKFFCLLVKKSVNVDVLL